ncbi:hypothetical protein [Ensifer aridi]|uniref:hypothetical protein n=1 Tax=Ensifer aridi TaxID=1708715 RepID=UPI00111BD4DC|nr:hypothetical protein [Ensifer aridi]
MARPKKVDENESGTLRAQMDPDKVAFIKATAKVRNKHVAQFVWDAVEAYTNTIPLVEGARSDLQNAAAWLHEAGDRIGVIRDFIALRYQIDSQVGDLKKMLETMKNDAGLASAIERYFRENYGPDDLDDGDFLASIPA